MRSLQAMAYRRCARPCTWLPGNCASLSQLRRSARHRSARPLYTASRTEWQVDRARSVKQSGSIDIPNNSVDIPNNSASTSSSCATHLKTAPHRAGLLLQSRLRRRGLGDWCRCDELRILQLHRLALAEPICRSKTRRLTR